MNYSPEILENKRRKKPHEKVVRCYEKLQPLHDKLKIYAIYLRGGQTVRIECYGYRYTYQGFSSAAGQWNEDKIIPMVSFYVDLITKDGKKSKAKTYDYHFFKLDDISAIVRESK